jgi:hypothetical protein
MIVIVCYMNYFSRTFDNGLMKIILHKNILLNLVNSYINNPQSLYRYIKLLRTLMTKLSRNEHTYLEKYLRL